MDFGDYRTLFSVKGVSRVGKFVEQPVEVAELERLLFPQRQSCRQKIFMLHGLEGIGKTQLAVEFTPSQVQLGVLIGWEERGQP